MKCLVCASEARDRTPRNFDGYVIECPELWQLRSRWQRMGEVPERLQAGVGGGTGKSCLAQRRG